MLRYDVVDNKVDESRSIYRVVVGMNIAHFVRRSTTTRMELNPLEFGSSSMKSIEIEDQGRSDTSRL